MILKRLLTGVSVCSFCLLLSAQQRVKMVVNDLLVPDKTEVLSGYVGEKLAASYEHRILAQSVDKLIEPFTNRVEDHLWQSEFWGKWMNSAVLAYRYQPSDQLLKTMKTAVDKLVATQDKKGYIGNYAPPRPPRRPRGPRRAGRPAPAAARRLRDRKSVGRERV